MENKEDGAGSLANQLMQGEEDEDDEDMSHN